MLFKNAILLLTISLNLPGFAQSSASPQVEIFEIEAPQLNAIRTIRIYLPAGYNTGSKSYPVLYMHDAQNLFDSTTAFSGEWKVDEFMNAQKGQKVIVVGIDHGNEKRINELTPFSNEKYGGGGGDAYVDFVVNTLKPHIDSTFRTLPDAETTAIMGSSLGGLISFYAAIKHPEVFGTAVVFSPSFWFSEKIYDFAESSEISGNTRFYFSAGTAESESMVAQLLKMKQLLLEKGASEGKLKVRIVEGGEHNEAFWSSEFPAAFSWLFPIEE